MPWLFALAWALGASLVVYGVAVLVSARRSGVMGVVMLIAGAVVLGGSFVLGEARGVHGAHVYTSGTGESGVAPRPIEGTGGQR